MKIKDEIIELLKAKFESAGQNSPSRIEIKWDTISKAVSVKNCDNGLSDYMTGIQAKSMQLILLSKLKKDISKEHGNIDLLCSIVTINLQSNEIDVDVAFLKKGESKTKHYSF